MARNIIGSVSSCDSGSGLEMNSASIVSTSHSGYTCPLQYLSTVPAAITRNNFMNFRKYKAESFLFVLVKECKYARGVGDDGIGSSRQQEVDVASANRSTSTSDILNSRAVVRRRIMRHRRLVSWISVKFVFREVVVLAWYMPCRRAVAFGEVDLVEFWTVLIVRLPVFRVK